ncbi:MAG: response regulator transcription factor [Chloroflexi bacterium]|nr:response regulator transcription factor [Chloroflexota bacterium]
MKVYVVDDSAIIRDRLKRMLADELNIQTIGETGDAQRAVEAIREQKPDVVLLDIQLLNGNGIDVLEQVKQVQPAPAVIVLTDYPYPEYRDRCMQAGADYFLIKSVEFDQVIPALNQIATRARDSAGSEHILRNAPQRDSCSALGAPTLPILMS